MWNVLGKTGRLITMLSGVIVIFSALALGAFRLITAVLPGYKSDLQAWASVELGLILDYDVLDLRLGFRGPEISFLSAALMAERGEPPYLLARSASVTFSPAALLFEREFRPKRLRFEGVSFSVNRAAGGELTIVGAPPEQVSTGSAAMEIPEDIELIIDDSELVFSDEVLGLTWSFDDVSGRLGREASQLSVTIGATPPSELGEQIDLSIDAVIDAAGVSTGDWQAYLGMRAAELSVLADLYPELGIEAGRGDVALWLTSAQAQIVELLADLQLTNLEVAAAEDSARFAQLDVMTEWHLIADGWRLALNELRVTGPSGEWDQRGSSMLEWSDARGLVALETDYLRLHDLGPLIGRLPETDLTRQWLEASPRGVIRELRLALEPELELSGTLEEVGFDELFGFRSMDGISGTVQAAAAGGSIVAAGANLAFMHPALLDAAVIVQDLEGQVIWREGRDGTRLVSNGLGFRLLDTPVSASLELVIPPDESPILDLDATVGSVTVERLKPWVIGARMRESVTTWLDAALGPGQVEQATVSFYGALDRFPFDAGDGEFRILADITDGGLSYGAAWPPAENFNGTIEFLNAGFRASGAASVKGNLSRDVHARIEDFRAPVIEVDVRTSGEFADFLSFLLDTPTIANYLGSGYQRLSAPAGVAEVQIDLDLPIPNVEAYSLTGELTLRDGELAFSGLAPHARELNGQLRLIDGVVTGEGISGIFLDGPVDIAVTPPESNAYRANIEVEGEVTADAVVQSFRLPAEQRLAGQTRWNGKLMLPRVQSWQSGTTPTRIEVAADLAGLALHLPEPFAKQAAEVTNLGIDFDFLADSLTVTANLGATRHFVGEFASLGERFNLTRGWIQFGTLNDLDLPQSGLLIRGRLPRLDLDRWRREFAGSGQVGVSATIAGADLDIGELSVFNQALGATAIEIRRDSLGYDVHLDSEPVFGTLRLPLNLAARRPVSANLERLYLASGSPDSPNELDPRELPGIDLKVAHFLVGDRDLGQVSADVQTDPFGLRLVAFSSETEAVSASATGSWLNDGVHTESRLSVTARSDDVEAALAQLGLDPLLTGRDAELSADLRWPGGPSGQWMTHLGGELSVQLNDGSVLDVEPGAGRLVGLMSIVALPRRLALDFRDVFNRGFGFDEISADFRIEDGDAYTDNLKLSGPGAEIGIVGRTGLQARDFEQQAIVTAEPGNMLPTAGWLIGGPGVGAALLIFTRIFKEPLKGIGRASYCISGGWDDPQVERITDEDLEAGTLCAALPSGWNPNLAEVP